CSFGHLDCATSDAGAANLSTRDFNLEPDSRGPAHFDSLLYPEAMRSIHRQVAFNDRACKGRGGRSRGRVFRYAQPLSEHARMECAVMVHRLATIYIDVRANAVHVRHQF